MKDMQKSKKKLNLRKQKPLDLKVRVPNEYHWVALRLLLQDLKPFASPELYTQLSTIISQKDFLEYMKLAANWGLQCKRPQETAVSTIRAELLLVSFLRKFDFPGERQVRIDAALETFFNAEKHCFLFNQIHWKALFVGQNDIDVAFATYIQSFIRKVLGDELPEIQEFSHWERHGPGSTTDTVDQKISNYWKFCNWPYSTTDGAKKHARQTIMDDARWLGALEDDYRVRYDIPKHAILNQELFWSRVFATVDGGRITTVPKNALTERTIAIEPTMNLFLQLGVDGFIRRRLKRYGVDLDCQAKNQELSRLGSKFDSFITIDLKAASDSISYRLVKQLFPSQWANYLDDLRSHYAWINNDLVQFEKLSSMGNGFTFAIESLIFTAIVFAATRIAKEPFDFSKFAVYGDDIIVPKTIADLVSHGIALCGFTVNTEKSFFEGDSRESCGADWWKGIDVRPVQLKCKPHNVKQLFSDLNRVRRQLHLWFHLDESFLLTQLTKWIPQNFKNLEGPCSDEEFDTYIHSPKKGRWNLGVYSFTRLISSPIPYKGCTKFLFRKLMHNLLGNDGRRSWNEKTYNSSGSRFGIFDRGKVKHTLVPTSHTDIWCDRYNPRIPKGNSLSYLNRSVG